jgi:hypothetical protein
MGGGEIVDNSIFENKLSFRANWSSRSVGPLHFIFDFSFFFPPIFDLRSDYTESFESITVVPIYSPIRLRPLTPPFLETECRGHSMPRILLLLVAKVSAIVPEMSAVE